MKRLFCFAVFLVAILAIVPIGALVETGSDVGTSIAMDATYATPGENVTFSGIKNGAVMADTPLAAVAKNDVNDLIIAATDATYSSAGAIAKTIPMMAAYCASEAGYVLKFPMTNASSGIVAICATGPGPETTGADILKFSMISPSSFSSLMSADLYC